MPQCLVHPIAPVFDSAARVLILGSFPSVRSRAEGFYYAHPQNRFWRVLSAVLDAPAPQTVEEKRALLLKNGIALWDVIARCEIEGSADASIAAAEVNDLRAILRAAPIEKIFCNGAAAFSLYCKHSAPQLGIAAQRLPSTSAANASWSLPRLIEAWGVILPEEERRR